MYWDEAYKGMPPWDIDHPQPAFQALIKNREIKPGRALDIGCGRGENAIMLAMSGCDVTGIDLVEDAISDAKAKAIERHVKVNFVLGDVLRLDRLFMRDRCIGCSRQTANISCCVSQIRSQTDTGPGGSQKLK